MHREKTFDTKFIAVILFTIIGFIIAVIVNIAVPQYAQINIPLYAFGGENGFRIDMNGAYRLLLAVFAIAYGGAGIYTIIKGDVALRKKYAHRAPFRFACGAVLAVWDILGTKLLLLPQPFFPGPAKIINPFLEEGNVILKHTLHSLRLFAVGFLIGVLLGVVTGILIGWFPKVYYWVAPVLKVTGVIPAVAWMPFALTLFKPAFFAAVFLIIICAWFPVASLTAAGIQSTPKAQFEAARTLGANTPFLVFHVAIPHAMPQIFTGIGTANAFAFTTLVIAEMMGQTAGLGYYINFCKTWSEYNKVFAAILVMAILFSLIMWGVGRIQAHALRWQKGLVRQ